MPQIVLITDAWGPKHGGINSFNTDFAKALSPVLAPWTRVTCVVMDATPEEVQDAAKHEVTLVSLGIKGAERVDASRATNVLDAVRQAGTDKVLWWVGHDVISGAAAVALPKQAGEGQSALIHHMNYLAYIAQKQGKASAAQQKHEEQRRLFRQADEVFAVGPLLQDSLSDLLNGRAVRMLVPGLAEIDPVPSPKTFSAITFGRLDPENDRIKQGRLAIAGFATACREANANLRNPKALRDNPLLRVIGVSPSSDEENELRIFAQTKAGRAINLLPLPYEEDRSRLFDELSGSSIAMMLSWHEGFGLTGWEAIAAEVPLVVSKKSGLYKLIDMEFGAQGQACVTSVDIRGRYGDLTDGDAENFDPADEKEVSEAILNLAHDLKRRKDDAKTLRTLLSSQSGGYTWPNTARSFADALGLRNQAEISASRPSATPAGVPPTPGAVSSLPTVTTGEPVPVEKDLLELRTPSWDGERGHPESQLLRPEEACVPFHASRRPLLDEVITWATAAGGLPAALQFRTGSAGAGKTRLMFAVCEELRRQDWAVGFLVSTPQQGLEKRFKAFLESHPKTFIVVDYAETRRHEVVDLLKAASTAPKKQRVRIVLLARDAGEWWDQLAAKHPLLEPFLTGRAVSAPSPIPEIPSEAQNRETLFHEALAAFASRLGKDPAGIVPPDLSAPHFANVLFIHLAAMASLSGERPERAASLLDATLRRERRHWYEAARAQGLPESLDPGLDQAVAMITLRAGERDAIEARVLLKSVPRLRGARPDEVDRVLEVLRSFYPVAGGIDALRPDILGERLVSQELAKDAAPLDVVLGKSANETTSRCALTVLNRLARQNSTDESWLQHGLKQHLELRAGLAVTVAIESGDPIGKVLAEVLENAPRHETSALSKPLRSRMPQETIALRECALALAQHQVERLEAKGKSGGNPQNATLAEAYLELGNRLAALQEYRKALVINEKALSLFRGLPKSNPIHAANLAMCLSNTSNSLGALGQLAEALPRQQEAVKILHGLVGSRRGFIHGALALALNNLAVTHQNLGHFTKAHQTATESLTHYRFLEKTNPVRFRWEVALALDNVAGALSALGRHEDALIQAEEASMLWDELVKAKPDAFQSRFADSLSGLAMIRARLGHYKEAQDEGERAVKILRELARFRPNEFRGDLGHALGNLAYVLCQLGQAQTSLALARESLNIEEMRAETEPISTLPQLARQNDNVARALAYLGRPHEAVPYAGKGLAIARKLVQERSEIFRPALMLASTLLAQLLILTGRLTEARDLLFSDRSQFEALRHGENARNVVPIRAEFLATVALVQLRLNEIKESTESSRSATALFEESLQDRPLFARAEASAAWCTRAACEADLGETENSQRSATRGLELLQDDLVETPRALPPWMMDVARDLFRLAGPLADPSAHAAVHAALHRPLQNT